MGLFGWIKKESNPHRRRESAPPLTSNITSSSGVAGSSRGSSSSKATTTRDDAYVEALQKFNEWRTKQRLERIAEGCPLEATPTSAVQHRIPSVIEEEKDSEGGVFSDFSSDVEVNSEEQRVLSSRKFEVPKSPRYSRHRQDSGAPKKPKRSVEFYRNINRIPENGGEHNLNNASKNNNASGRYSMPTVMPSGLTPKRSKARLSKPNNSQMQTNNNNTIYENEVEEFEHMHVQDTLGDSYAVQSPPSRFYKENASPYSNTSIVTTARCTNPKIVDSTPKKQTNLLQKSSRFRSFKDKPAPPPPPTPKSEPTQKRQNRANESASDSPFAGSYRNYDLHSSSIYDEHVISSRGYRGNMKSFADHSPGAKERRKSPSYQTIVNKHGDLVDYALPFSDTTDTHSEINASKNCDLINDIRSCEEIINENFRFLNSDVQPSTIVIDDSTSMITEPISVLKERAPQIITDLDRSTHSTAKRETTLNEVDLVIHEPQDILLELDSLEKWSKSIQISDDFLQKQFAEKDMLEYFQRTSSQLLICWPKEVHYRVGSLRSSFMAPLEYSCGLFRNAPVTLRKYSLNVERSLYFAEEACKKDFELLNQIKHYAIATLMAVCFDPGLNQSTLVLEPFDFTLFDYIHKMNKRLSLLHAITVVQQIAAAVSYMQDCGYIHSNISSGAILMRKYPYTVKLTSFELTTEVSDTVRKEIENRYGSTSSSRNSMTSSQNEELKKITTYSRLIKNDEQFLRDKYRKLSREISENRKGPSSSVVDNSAYDCQASKYLPYCKEYREKFSMFYYVAPELLVPKANFVFPSKSTDVYSLTLLLWEILNGYIPFVVYNRQELEKLQVTGNLHLPMFEKERCDHFRSVFETGLADLCGRKLSVGDILNTLECLLLEQGSDKNGQMSGFSEDYEEQANTSEIRKKNELNDVRKQNAMEKTDKIYFQSNNGYVNTENVMKISRDGVEKPRQQPIKPARKINRNKAEKVVDDETKHKKSPFGSSFNLSNSAIYQTIFDFNNKFLSPKSSKQGVYERTSTVKKHKKPTKTNKKAAKELFEPTKLGNGTVSFRRLSSGDSRNDVLNEVFKTNTQEVIGPLEVHCKESPAKLNINNEKAKFLKEIIMDQDDPTKESPLATTSKSCDSSPGSRRKNCSSKLSNSMRFAVGDFTLPDTPIARKNRIRKHAWLSDQKLGISDENTSTPVTPQGRRACSFFNDLGSRIGRAESGFYTPLNLNISSSMQEIKPKTINISVNIIKSRDMGGQLKTASHDFSRSNSAMMEVSVSESDNKDSTKKSESTNNIFEGTLWKKEKELCERKQLRHSADNLDEAQADTSASVITAHLTSVRDTIRKIETTFENTGFDYSPGRKLDNSKKPCEGRKVTEDSLVVEENLLIPTKILEMERIVELPPTVEEPPTAVTRLDVVLTNNTQKKKDELMQQQQTPRQTPLPDPTMFSPNSQLFMRRKATNSGSVIQRTVYRESIVSSADLPGLDQANGAQSTSTPLPPGSARKKKLTTRVTVNMRKISRRASDIGGSCSSPVSSRPNSLNLDEDLPSSGCVTPTNAAAAASLRHSCGSDLLKALAKVRLTQSSEEMLAAGNSRCSSVNENRSGSAAAAVERRSMCTPVKMGGGGSGSSRGGTGERMVCCNCGSSMVPADTLNVPTGSRIGMSAAFSELNFPRESLASMFEDNMGFKQQQQQYYPPGTPTAGRQTLMIPNARSTEDLYIDDDFCQGLNLGANMELVEFIDDGHYLDEFGYDIYTTEEIYDDEEGHAGAIGDGGLEEEQFLSKCADMNPTSIDAIGSVFSPIRPDAENQLRLFELPSNESGKE